MTLRPRLLPAKKLTHHPERRDEYVREIGEKGRLIALDQVPEQGQSEGSRDYQQSDNPMKLNDNQGRETDRDCDHVQRTIDRVVVRTVVMGVKAHIRAN